MKRLFLLIAGAALIVNGLWAFGSAEEPAPEAPRVIQAAALNGPSGLGMVRLFEEPPALGEGITAEFSVVMAPDVMMAKLMEGSVDIAALPVNLPALLYAKGSPYILGAVVGNGMLYTVSTDESIQSFDDLRGRTLYTISPNSTPDILTRYLLSENNLETDKDVTLDFSYGHTELAQALIAGLVDTATLPEPFITMVTMKNPKLKVVLDYQKEFSRVQGSETTYPITAIAVRRELAEEQPEALARFFEAYRDSIDAVNGDPETTGKLAAKHGFTLPPAVTAASVPRLNLTFLAPLEARPSLEAFFKVLADVNPKSIGGALPDDGFYLDLGD